jgi:hypothetical protein
VACDKDPKIERVYFKFEMPFAITPGNDTVRLGDTIMMEANFSDTLLDVLRQEKFDLDCFPFQIFMVVCELVDPAKNFSFQKAAINAFDFNFESGYGGVDGSESATINLKCQNGRYTFRMKFVPIRRGVFTFALIDRSSSFVELPSRLAPSDPGTKRIPVVNFNRYVFNGGKTHFNIYKQNALPALSDPNDPQLEELSRYTIVVK